MSIAQTFTVTVVGGKYYIDGVQQATVMIGAGLTYKFDQSDSSNENHPLRFSSDSGNSTPYTVGVTAVGTPGDSGAYTQIDVQNGAPSTLYYYCTNHSGMGGQANTDGWGRSYFGQADWGDTNIVTEGWGRLAWGAQGWGEAPGVTLSGQSATTSIGSITVELRPGWGTLDWGENGWGSVEEGIENLTGQSATASVGAITPADVVGLTGQAATTSVGELTFVISPTIALTGQAATVSDGQLDVNDGSEQLVGLASLVATTAVGSISLEIGVNLTGVDANSSVGSISTNAEDLINVTGVGATSSVGSLTLEIGVPLTGVSATASVGTISPADVMGLSGQEAVSSVGNVAPLGYGDVDITGNTSYNGIDVSGNTSYTDVTHAAQEKKIMASTYTPLGVELMATGENAGTWGTKTNTNLNLFEQITGGYKVQTLNAAGAGANTTELAVSDGSTGATLATRVIVLGAESAQTISGNKIVTIPLDVENTYFILNNTSGAYTVQFKYVSGSGDSVTWAATDKGWKILSASGNDGTNPDVKEVVLGGLPGGSDTQVQFNSSGSFAGDADLIWTAGTALTINSQKELRLADSDDSAYIGQKASATTTSYTLTWPAGVAGGNGYVLKSTTGGVLSWEELEAGGTSWQAVKTANFTAAAGQGVFCNTTGGSFTLTLPSSPTIGDEVSFIDYAGTFDTNALTIGRNSEKINGAASDLTVSTERAANTLVYTDGTQGWLLKSN